MTNFLKNFCNNLNLFNPDESQCKVLEFDRPRAALILENLKNSDPNYSEIISNIVEKLYELKQYLWKVRFFNKEKYQSLITETFEELENLETWRELLTLIKTSLIDGITNDKFNSINHVSQIPVFLSHEEFIEEYCKIHRMYK